jgi:hypothetical protein
MSDVSKYVPKERTYFELRWRLEECITVLMQNPFDEKCLQEAKEKIWTIAGDAELSGFDDVFSGAWRVDRFLDDTDIRTRDADYQKMEMQVLRDILYAKTD